MWRHKAREAEMKWKKIGKRKAWLGQGYARWLIREFSGEQRFIEEDGIRLNRPYFLGTLGASSGGGRTETLAEAQALAETKEREYPLYKVTTANGYKTVNYLAIQPGFVPSDPQPAPPESLYRPCEACGIDGIAIQLEPIPGYFEDWNDADIYWVCSACQKLRWYPVGSIW